MADISTAVSMARVPILGEDGRISDDYIPAAIPEAERVAQEAASQAKSAATAAKGSASAAGTSATQASSSASAASTSATKAQQSAEAAGGSATSAKSAQTAAETAKTAAEKAKADAADSAQSAQQSASAAATSASSVADKFISSAQATTLEPGSQATASVENQVLTIGVPKGEKGDTPTVGIGTVETLPAGSSATATTTSTDTGVNINLGIPKGDPGDVSAVQAAEGSGLSVSTDGGTVTIDDSALRERIAELENQAANVVTGTSTGYVAHGEDAYAQKPREVRIKGKTWVNRWPELNARGNGIYVSTDETGLITVTGELTTSTSGSYISMGVNGISVNKSITALCSRGLPDGVYLYVNFRDSDNAPLSGEMQVGFSSTTETQKSATVPADTASILAGVAVKPNTVLSSPLSFRVMLVDGTEAPNCFTPCASITSVQPENLVTAGKNFFPTGDDEGWYKGDYAFSKAIVQKSMPVTLPYTSPVESTGVGNVFPATAGQTYALSVTGYPTDFSTGLNWALYESVEDVSDSTKAVAYNIGGGALKSLTTDVMPTSGYLVVCIAGQWTDGHTNVGEYPSGLRIQCELGSTATAYEPPNVTTTPLPEVELRSLPDGTCDELVIKADGTCEVERRTGYIASYADEEVTGEYVSTGNGLEAGASIVYELDEQTTEPQSPVTLPALPAPTFNQYHDADVPSDTSTEYARDINLVIDKLQAQISATTVREATNG